MPLVSFASRFNRVVAAAALAFTTALVSAVDPVTIHLAGDSTMAPKREDRRPETGWGERLQEFFDPAAVRVMNHAVNGRSTRTFLSEGRWHALLDSMRAGDYVFIEFGHNDESKDKVDRYTPPDDYRANLIRFVRDVRDRKGTPVLLTPIARRRFDSTGAFYDTHGVYPDIVRGVAHDYVVPLIDLHRSTSALLARLGADSTRSLFLHLRAGQHANYPTGLDDDTHLSPAGARIVASLAVAALRELRLNPRLLGGN